MTPDGTSLGLVAMVLVAVLTTSRSGGMLGADALLLPYGEAVGDTNITATGGSSPALSLPSNFTFFRDSYGSIYANVDGFLSFTSPGVIFDVNQDFDSLGIAVVCVFCADFFPSGQNVTWYRLSTDSADLQIIQVLARGYSEFGSTFTPAWVFVYTWDGVGSFADGDKGNTVQVAVSVADDGSSTSLVLLHFQTLEWLSGFTGGSINTKVGFNKGDGTAFYLFPESKSSNLSQLVSTSNIASPGLFLFRVDQDTVSAAPTPITTTAATTSTTASPTLATTLATTTTATTTALATTAATIPTTAPTTVATTTSSPATTTTTTAAETTTTTTTTTAATTELSSSAPTSTAVVTPGPVTSVSPGQSTGQEQHQNSRGPYGEASSYYIGFGVAGGVVVIVVIACVVYGKMSATRARAKVFSGSHVDDGGKKGGAAQTGPAKTDHHHHRTDRLRRLPAYAAVDETSLPPLSTKHSEH